MSVGSWINSGLGPAGNLARRVPWQLWLAAAGLLLAAFWLAQHDARIRRQAQLQQLKQQTSAEVAALKKQAGQDVKQANVVNAGTIKKLEERRRRMEQQNQQLAAQLAALRQQARFQAEQVATLPIRDVVTRVATQLGLQSEDIAAKEGSHSAGAEGMGSAHSRHALPEGTTPHPAAGAATLSPGRGLNSESFADIAQNATSASAGGKQPLTRPLARPPSPLGEGSTDGPASAPATNAKPGGGDTAATTPVALALTGSGVRKVETALVELNSCRAESKVESRQVSALQARAVADDATIKSQAGSIISLNQAISAKDKILGRQASECKAELRAARGTFLGRLAHVSEHIAIGVAVGLAVGVVVR